MNRRQFAFWIGTGLFGLSSKLRAESLDSLAAMVMCCTESCIAGKTCVEQVRWTYQENHTWRWFERETLIDGEWELTGRTTPINRKTGEAYTGETGYLDESLVPHEIRFGDERAASEYATTDDFDEDDFGEVSATRHDREGRPPSKWLRSLYAEELRLWLPAIDVPAVGVSGMTVWTHLTRDHRFLPTRIEGLTEPEMAKLHAAAHFGY